MKKTALVICIHDGIETYYCGVGTVGLKTIASLKILKKRGLLKNTEIHIITDLFDHRASFFRRQYFTDAKRLARSTGGDLYEIRLLPKNQKTKTINDNWGHQKWAINGKQAAKIISKLNNKQIIFMAHDISFGLVCHYVKPKPNIMGYFIPHSTGVLFNESIRFLPERLIFKGIREKNYKIAYINDFMKGHLIKDYKISPSLLVPLKNSMVSNEGKLRASEESVREIYKKYNIKLTEKIIFSFGRCGSQKGFELLIKAFKNSRAYKKNYKLILLAPVDITSTKYVKKIAKLLGTLRKDKYVWIKEFRDPIPFLNMESLDTVVLSSKFECAPFTPLEACLYSNRAKILYSNIKPFTEILKNIKGAVRVKDFKVSSWSKAINLITSAKKQPKKIKFKTYDDNLYNLLKKRLL